MDLRSLLTAAWDMLNEDPLWCIVALCAVGAIIYFAYTTTANLP